MRIPKMFNFYASCLYLGMAFGAYWRGYGAVFTAMYIFLALGNVALYISKSYYERTQAEASEICALEGK